MCPFFRGHIKESITFDEAVLKFVGYLASYRSYSPSTVGAYRRDLQLLREFLSGGNGNLPRPGEITRQQVVQFGVSLSAMAPLSVRRRLACLSCKRTYEREDVPLDAFPPMCACMNVLKPDVVFFGEMIPMHALLHAQAEAEGCDVMLVIGTSAQVVPAANLPRVAKSRGATIIEINPEPTPLTSLVADISIHESASTAVPTLANAVKNILQST